VDGQPAAERTLSRRMGLAMAALALVACASGRVPEDAGRAWVDVASPRADGGRGDGGAIAHDGGAPDSPGDEPDGGAPSPDAWMDCGGCAPFSRCEGGRCVDAPACVESATCETGEVCVSSRCVSGAADIDGDGSPARVDCDETNPAIHPGAADPCNGVDDNCDGTVDPATATYYPDADRDGFGDANLPYASCTAPAGYVAAGGDCDDARADTHPGAAEVCNGRDDDCAGGDRCPSGCRAPEVFGGHTYVYCHTARPWTTARDQCAAAGMQLVRIDSRAENDFVQNLLEDSTAYIGASDRDSEGRWRWVDGGALSYSRWASGEPNDAGGEDCGRLYGDRGTQPGLWVDVECTSSYDWTCESM